jgi:predicted DNA-binding protein (MmcQ/YjbR family)
MDIDWLRQHCLSLPHTTETIQWGSDLVFKIAGKMYTVLALEPEVIGCRSSALPTILPG